MNTQLTWYGQSAFKVVTPGGKVFLIDPWLTNPVFERGKDEMAALKDVDLILEFLAVAVMSFGKFRRHPLAHFFAHEHRVGADVDDALLLEQSLHERLDMRINQRFAAADRNHRRVTFLGRAQTILQTHYVLERSRVFANPSAPGAGEIAGVQRFELQHGGEFLRSAQFLPNDVGSDLGR